MDSKQKSEMEMRDRSRSDGPAFTTVSRCFPIIRSRVSECQCFSRNSPQQQVSTAADKPRNSRAGVVELCLLEQNDTDGGPREGVGGCCGGPTKAHSRLLMATRSRVWRGFVLVLRVLWSGYAG
jgi:hypothetical protein